MVPAYIIFAFQIVSNKKCQVEEIPRQIVYICLAQKDEIAPLKTYELLLLHKINLPIFNLMTNI
jgi:hypothetical protein